MSGGVGGGGPDGLGGLLLLGVAVEALAGGAALLAFGAGERGTLIALQLTGRVSFLLFLPAYAGRSLRLIGAGALGRHARDFGIACALAHLVHLGLVAWLCAIGHAPARGTFVFFGVATASLYGMLVLSLPAARRVLPPGWWHAARVIAMNVVLYAFAADFLGAAPALTPKYLAGYVPFAALALGAVVLRLAAR